LELEVVPEFSVYHVKLRIATVIDLVEVIGHLFSEITDSIYGTQQCNKRHEEACYFFFFADLFHSKFNHRAQA